MKKLVFNGCSLVAGDAITWDMHYPDIDWDKHIYSRSNHDTYSSQEIEQKRIDYMFNLRKLDNLSGQVGKILGLPVDDLSVDGNTNQNICMTTISFLSKLSIEERKQYHVCIGWTEPSRRTKWDPKLNEFSNLNVHSKYDFFSNYIKEVIFKSHEIDHSINYLHNVITLQSYLRSNGITYTFWNSLGTIKNITTFKPGWQTLPYQHELLFDKNDWLLFEDTEYPWQGNNFWSFQFFTNPSSCISNTNKHPNLETVIDFANKVANHVGVLFNN
jgi:hypothetical protein